MEYGLVAAGFVVGLGLVAASAVTAFVYTPYTSSLFDTTVTAAVGASLQIGNFLVVGACSAVLFDLIAAGGVRIPLTVASILGYAVGHVVNYTACLRITDLQDRPLDPDVVVQSSPLKLLSRSLPTRASKGGGN